MTTLILASLSLALAAFQAAMIFRNLKLFTAPSEASASASPALSVLVPARDEEINLAALLQTLALQRGLEFEVVVMDDGSTDRTMVVALEAASRDPRVRALSAPPLPTGWAGKQHACHLLSLEAHYEQWLFVDADVAFTDPRALARISRHLANGEAAMQSALPRQLTLGWAEQLIVPLIHLILLGFLPFWEMRRNRMPALGAACGQMVALKAEPYRSVGGHAAIRHRLHDATALAALLRGHGHLSDMFDATSLADCRMYVRNYDVFDGFAKNATEGMARPLALPFWSVLLLGANVVPWLLLWTGHDSAPAVLAAAIDLATFLALRKRFQQTLTGALTRPLGVIVLMTIQWAALLAKWGGRQASWKGRSYKRIHE